MQTIVVGNFEATGIDREHHLKMLAERADLTNSLKQANIPFELTDTQWPRNSYVLFNGKRLDKEQLQLYADGGYILSHPRFTLACAEVSNPECLPKDDPNIRYQKLQELYGKDIFILPSPDLSLNDHMSPHIDLVVLPIHQKKILFVDHKYYFEIAKKEVDRVIQETKYKLIILPSNYQIPSFPCNSLIVEDREGLVAVTNSDRNRQFIDLLKAQGVKVIAVPFSANCSRGGSVHCATNLK